MNNEDIFFSYINEEKIRIDTLLSRLITLYSRVYLVELIESGNLQINNEINTQKNTKIEKGDLILIKNLYKQKKEEKHHIEKLNKPLNVIFENENIIIINKEKGLTVHPGAGNKNDTLVNVLNFHFSDLSNLRGDERIGIVHRLDKDTSGLMIIAKNNQAHFLISEMIKNKEIIRKYVCLCYKTPFPASGKIETRIKRDRKNIEKMKIEKDDIDAKIAITNYKVLKTFCQNNISLLECKLETGRTHQIRLHMEYIKCPILYDEIYNKGVKILKKEIIESEFYKNLEQFKDKGQMLHSYYIEFKEPITGEEIKIINYPDFWKYC